MTTIIGFLGEKQSGKNTCCNFLYSLKIKELGISKDCQINDQGVIEVTDIFGEKPKRYRTGQDIGEFLDWFPYTEDYVNVDQLGSDILDKYVKIYALADPLKEICVDLFGLKPENVYGTDEQKNEIQEHLLWENMPGVSDVSVFSHGYMDAGCETFGVIHHKPGPMTAREFMQFLGTDLMRKINPNIWVEALMRKIENDKPDLALISDVRFDNEVKLLKKNKAKIIGLKRHKKGQAKLKHSSEKANLKLAHFTIHNEKISIEELCKRIYESVKSLNGIPNWKARVA